MARSWLGALMLWGCLAAGAGTAFGEEPASAPGAAADELRRLLEQVKAGQAESQKAWRKLEASTRAAARVSASADATDFAAQWMKTVASGGPEKSAFYAGTKKALESWIQSIEDGSNRFPPIQEIRGSMSKWQEQNASLLNALETVAEVEIKWRAAEFKAIPRMKPESVEWVYAREEQNQRDLTIRKLLADAGSILGSPGGVPAPLASRDRADSPFSRAANPATPDRLWIFLGKASTRIGETIPVEIGLGNRRGPNATADQDYRVSLSCKGCLARKSELNISKGDRSVQTEIQVTEAQASVTAQNGNLSPATLEAFGCAEATGVTLAAEKVLSEGVADGRTRVLFRLVFRDSKQQLATDLKRKSIVLQYSGVGERVALSGLYRSVPGEKNRVELGADECVSPQGAVSPLVGTAKVSAAIEGRQALPLEFKFGYAFPVLDQVCIALGILFGFLTNFSILKNRLLTWVVGWLVSAAGAGVLVWVGYSYYLDSTPVTDTWIVVLVLATVGGVAGVTCLKLFTAENVQAPPDYSDNAESV